MVLNGHKKKYMKLNEFRIGNLVTLCIINDEYMEFDLPIHSLQGDNTVRLLKDNKSIGCFSLKQIKPIPVTDEWLLKFRFEKDLDGSFIKDSIAIFADKNLKTNLFIQENKDNLNWFSCACKIQYLHQLQIYRPHQ